MLIGRWIRGEGIWAIPIFRDNKPYNEARRAQHYDGSGARWHGAAYADCRAKVKKGGQAMATGSHMLNPGIGEGEGPRSCRIFAQERIVRTIGSPCVPRLSLRIHAQLVDEPLLGVGMSLNLSHLVLPYQGYQN